MIVKTGTVGFSSGPQGPGTGCLTAGMLLRNAAIAAAPALGSSENAFDGIHGDSLRPSGRTPVVKAVTIWSVVQPPRPVSMSGVRFRGTKTPRPGSPKPMSAPLEGFFSKLARSVLRHIRVASKQELKERILAAIDDINKRPVVHSWSYKLDQAA